VRQRDAGVGYIVDHPDPFGAHPCLSQTGGIRLR
jgi:hypothetical protein